jgi:hypothetical protein
MDLACPITPTTTLLRQLEPVSHSDRSSRAKSGCGKSTALNLETASGAEALIRFQWLNGTSKNRALPVRDQSRVFGSLLSRDLTSAGSPSCSRHTTLPIRRCYGRVDCDRFAHARLTRGDRLPDRMIVPDTTRFRSLLLQSSACPFLHLPNKVPKNQKPPIAIGGLEKLLGVNAPPLHERILPQDEPHGHVRCQKEDVIGSAHHRSFNQNLTDYFRTVLFVRQL